MCDNLNLNSLSQKETPMNTLFFSEFNRNVLQRGIRQTFKNKTGIAIDYQNDQDLYGIMRVAFINNSGDHYHKVNEQVKFINEQVINTAVSQIQTGVTQYIDYLKDSDTIANPEDRPVSTSLVGMKIPKNSKIGM